MKKTLFSLLLLPFLANASLTPEKVEGEYLEQNDYGHTNLKTLSLGQNNGQNVMAATTTTSSNTCRGEMNGIGVLTNNVLTFAPLYKISSSDQCVIRATFSNKGRTVSIEESNCISYHGVSCGWEGQTIKKIK